MMQRRTWYLQTNSLIAVWLVALGIAVLVHRFVPASGWLMVHLLLLGAVSTAILIWSQHFADTLLRHPALGGRRSLVGRLAAHTTGAVLVVAGMISGWWPLVLIGGILLGLVALVHGLILGQQLRVALPSRFGSLVRYYVAASGSLVIGVGFGVWMANPATGTELHARLYVAHISMNVLGWIGLTAIGTLLLLWPTVLHARLRDTADAVARRALPILAVGVLLLAAASLWGPQLLAALGALVYLVGLAPVLWEAVQQARHTPPKTYAGWSLAAAMVWLAFSVGGMGLLVATAPGWAEAPDRLAWLLTPLVAGFGVQLLLGALSYLIPVVTGGGPEAGRAAAAELDRAAVFRVLVVNGGIALYLLPLPSLVRVTLSLVVFVVLLSFLVLAVRAIIAGGRIRQSAEYLSAPKKDAVRRETPGPIQLVRTGRSGMAAAVAVLVLAVTVGVALDPASVGTGRSATPGAAAATGHTTAVTMTMKDMRFSPSTVTMPAGDRLVIILTNEDDIVHDLTLANGITSGRVAPGERVTVNTGVISKDSDGWCSIAGHRQMGMVMKIAVTGALSSPSAGDQQPADSASAADDINLQAEPPTGFRAHDAVLPPAPAETVHKYTFTVKDEEVEVSPGVTQTLWPFNGTAPGPTLRGKVGDVFEITLINDATMGHSIDFHAGSLAPDAPMRTIEPGEQLLYRFTATKSGSWLYHCSTHPMSLHIANGMFGAVIIDPPGLDPVAREYVLVQSEYYLGPQGGIADAAKVAAGTPDLIVFNGYANQYKFQPLEARVGERIRIWVVDAGPNVGSAFHVVGGQFDTVFAEGDYLLRAGGSTGTGGSQVLGLTPAQGGFVELTFPEAGTYPFVTHAMADAEKGGAGYFRVVP